MSMSSETEVLKTNEFLRRRKLRLQQVREQSKDIAKKIRQRAKVEKLQQIVALDSKKEKEYFLKQEKLVKRLEQLYSQGVQSVGDSHKKASEVTQNETSPEKSDLSKLRGKEAVAELRRKKQEKLDEQKKLLDRKLLAREAANEISREKSSIVSNKLLAKSSSSKLTEETDTNTKECSNGDLAKVTKSDMATQWDFEELPNEWEPTVPALSLPRDDKDSLKDSNNAESKSNKSKRLDLFALSAEMPSSLRGGITTVPEDKPSIRPSLNLVTEYLQSRALRLRETDTTGSNKKPSDDLSHIKQTILRSRSSKIEAKGSTNKSTLSSGVEPNLTKKNSVTMYNHSTRDSRDIPRGDSQFVVRDVQTDDDAYSQALKESTEDHSKDKQHQKKLQEMRHKVAVTKQTVEKEYNDTMSFLKTLPKEKCSKHVKNAYMDDRRQQILKVSRQQKLQQEFNKIEKECRKNCEKTRSNQSISSNVGRKSKSPAREELDEDFETRDLQYSWMPVPESDGNLAIHTIPTRLKEAKSGNSVKFSKVDSYHEYRSRHKHTPPTKDTNNDKQPSKRLVEKVIIQNDNEDSTECSSISSDSSSVENLNLGKTSSKASDQVMSEADRIIIYKILDKKEKERKKLKFIDNVAKVLKSMDKNNPNKASSDDNNNEERLRHDKGDKDSDNRIPIDQLNEGVYKVVSEKGDNIASLYFSDNIKTQEGRNIVITEEEQKLGRPCCCDKKLCESQQSDKGTNLTSKNEVLLGSRPDDSQGTCKCGSSRKQQHQATTTPPGQPSAATSTSSFKTATTDKTHGAPPDGGFVKLIDDAGHEAGKFYIGASGFLKDNAYEVVIQLRKKDQVAPAHDKDNVSKSQKKSVVDEETVVAGHDLADDSALSSGRLKSDTVKKQDQKLPEIEKLDVVNTDKGPAKMLSPVNKDENGDLNSIGSASSVSIDEPISKTGPEKKLVDKGVHTSFLLDYAVPSHFPKTDDIPRPATSTYTQTTMDSPNPRPVFVHMSSSTSTAYMSPPEMVMPNFMRRDDYQGEKLKMPDRSEHCANKYCTKKRCKCHKIKSSESSKKVNSAHRMINTPPNTARDNTEDSDIFVNNLEWAPQSSRSGKCHKCTSKSVSARDAHQKRKKDGNTLLHKISSRNLVMRVSSSTASSFKHNKLNNFQTNKRMNKADLNPIIKKYVNRLLQLNKEGMNAVEVANQECSSVSTPGSSIIEVSRNFNDKVSSIDNKLSLEQMKNVLKEKILEEYVKETRKNNSVQTLCNSNISRTNKLVKKRSVHRVKSLNISKRLLHGRKQSDKKFANVFYPKANDTTSSAPSAREFHIDNYRPEAAHIPNKNKIRSKSSPTPRQHHEYESNSKNMKSDTTDGVKFKNKNKATKSSSEDSRHKLQQARGVSSKIKGFSISSHRITTTSPDSDLDALKRRQDDEAVTNISTQTSHDLDSEINLMKLAEDKLQNMEKIADLTEKCTKRLSNLAKVLEEVRKNKSLAYSQISTSDTASDSDHKSDKNISVDNVGKRSYEVTDDVQDKTDPKLFITTSTEPDKELTPSNSSEYIPFLTNIPKPTEFKYPTTQSSENTDIKSPANTNVDSSTGRRREKPPPALSRIHLKLGQDIVPHELSTVVEVDSPMSVKMKNQSSTNTRFELSDMSFKMNDTYKDQKGTNDDKLTITNKKVHENPDILQNSANISKALKKISSNDSSDDSKMQMMDLKQFNELMLKPFISIQEFAKQCGNDVEVLDDGSNLDDIPKDDGNDELSSLHSDGSLPDVIAELLKRNIITEPFKFDTLSNVNSTTVSSESLSVLALSKARNNKKKSSVVFQTQGNASETSDSLSISSNPDLENAFKKLGMGWASSTLKKTKERLALSSSSNTSSSSLSQFKLKSLNDKDVPVLVTDSVLSETKLSSKKQQEKRSAESSRNAEQQTSFLNSMTVKDFLTNELAKKITFTNKSNRNETEEEFVSLFETKMPEEMKHNMSQSIRDERSVESGQNNRARTSTPVQIFKSMTYHSSSSSNLSNGLFSNADDLSSVKGTSNSVRNHSTSEKDDLTIPNCSLKMRKGASDCSKSE